MVGLCQDSTSNADAHNHEVGSYAQQIGQSIASREFALKAEGGECAWV